MTTAKLVGQQNQCQTCKRFFARTSGFDKHRVGPFGDGPNQTSPNRRCMTDAELEKAGCRVGVDGFLRFLDKRGTRNIRTKQNASTPSAGES